MSCSELLSQDEWDEMLVCGIVCVVYVAVCARVCVCVCLSLSAEGVVFGG